jgi:plasmid stabilization system protein ParE
MTGCALHPEAFADVDQLWEYIADHNIDAADRVVDEIVTALRTLVASPHIGHRRRSRWNGAPALLHELTGGPAAARPGAEQGGER